jgi:hypothetical protein
MPKDLPAFARADTAARAIVKILEEQIEAEREHAL